MLAQARVIGFIPVADFDAAEAFYCGKLGLTAESRDDYALVVRAAGGVMVRCVKAEGFTPQPFTVFGWEVRNLGSMAERMAEAGVEALRVEGLEQDERGVWTAPGGAQVLWFKDPFGNTLSLSHHGMAGAE